MATGSENITKIADMPSEDRSSRRDMVVNASDNSTHTHEKSEKPTSQDNTPDKPPRDISGAKWAVVVVAILSSTFLFALDNTVVADVQPQIVLQFNSVSQISWVAVAFIMAAVSTNLFFGQLYSQVPAKWLYISSTTLFEVGSALCGAAPNMSALIVGRALAGLGGIGMYLGVLSLLHHTTTIQERPLYVAGVGLTWAMGTILGPVIGGAFTDSAATWRWAFYINLVIFAVALPVYIFLLPLADPCHDVPTPVKTRLSHVDWVGAVLMLGTLLSFTMAINFGGIMYEWSSAQEIAMFVVTGVLFVALTAQQYFSLLVRPGDRIFPTQIVAPTAPGARTVVLVFCATAAGGAALFVPINFLPIFFQFARGDSAREAAVRLLPFIVCSIVMTLGQGAILGVPGLGLYFPWYLAGGLATTAGAALMYTVDADTSTAAVYGYSALLGVGAGSFVQSGFSIAQASVSLALGHVAAAFVALGQTGGITISLAIGNSVFINRAGDGLAALLPAVPRGQIQMLIAGVSDREGLVSRLSPELQRRILEVVVEAISRTYILVIVAGAVAAVTGLLMKKERLFLKPAAVGA